eukprot:SAG31_NODE_3159_length_4609_cov_3.554324_4_plen_130_part_00
MARISLHIDDNPSSRVVETFFRVDTDGSGELDSVEFEEAMEQLGLSLTATELGLVLNEFDEDESERDVFNFLLHACYTNSSIKAGLLVLNFSPVTLLLEFDWVCRWDGWNQRIPGSNAQRANDSRACRS